MRDNVYRKRVRATGAVHVTRVSPLFPRPDLNPAERLIPSDSIPVPRLVDAFRNRAVIAFSVLLLMTLAVRLITWRKLLPQIDEPATLLAIDMVRHKGIPLFPSDVLYLQGALISYLGAPFAFFLSGSQLLHGLQLANLVASLSVIVLGFLITFRLTRSIYPSLLAAGGIGMDPTMLIWSIYIRPYGLLTMFTTAIVYCFIVMIQEGVSARILRFPARYWMVVLFWLATFTHIAVWLIFPSMVFIAVMVWGTSLLRRDSGLVVAGVAAVAAPLMVTALGSLIGVGSSTSTAEGGAGFVGDHVLDLGRFLEPQFTVRIWENVFIGSQLTQLMPYYILGLLGVLFGLFINVTDRQSLLERRMVYALIVLYMGPILTIAFLTSVGSQSRYIVHFLPSGYVLIAVAIWHIARIAPGRRIVGAISIRGLAVLMLVLPTVIFAVQGAQWRMEYSEDDPDYFPAFEYVADNMQPGDLVFVSLPPVAYFTLSAEARAAGLYFLAGPADRERTNRYLKFHQDGRVTDYWLGVPAVTSTEQLCLLIYQRPERAWFVVDEERLAAAWAYQGPMANVIRDTTVLMAEGANGTHVFRTKPIGQWGKFARRDCTNLSFGEPAGD